MIHELTWSEAALGKIKEIFYASSQLSFFNDSEGPVDELNKIFDDLSNQVKNNNQIKLRYQTKNLSYHPVEGYSVYHIIGACAVELLSEIQKIEDFIFLINDMGVLLTKKQKDYGPNNILQFGHVGLIVRMFDKISRLNNFILKNGTLANSIDKNSVQNETVIDTLMDLIGYSAIGLMLSEPDPVYGSYFLLPMD
jgi:hypothetical protein